ncbi:C-type lectin-like [Trinorchestia longiramus]|nr:C-type lectin-like [Trinorchestia longiramus]
MRCFVDSTCLAVSAEMKTGSNKCSFSTYVGVVSSLVSANNSEGNDVGQFTSNISTLTFVRKGCREIFDQVGSTCYFFSRRKADFKSATASCPASSALAFPSTEFKFKTLVDYMKKEKLDSDEWYVDLTLQNGKWFWSDGTEMTASRYLGDDVTIPCARIQDNSHLNDIDCSREFNFICQYEAQA